MKKLLGLVLAASGVWFLGCGDSTPVAPPVKPAPMKTPMPMGDMPEEPKADAPKEEPKADAPKEEPKEDAPKEEKKDE